VNKHDRGVGAVFKCANKKERGGRKGEGEGEGEGRDRVMGRRRERGREGMKAAKRIKC